MIFSLDHVLTAVLCVPAIWTWQDLDLSFLGFFAATTDDINCVFMKSDYSCTGGTNGMNLVRLTASPRRYGDGASLVPVRSVRTAQLRQKPDDPFSFRCICENVWIWFEYWQKCLLLKYIKVLYSYSTLLLLSLCQMICNCHDQNYQNEYVPVFLCEII